MTQPNFGLSLNNRLAVCSGKYSIKELLKLAELADSTNLHSIWVGDSLIDSPRYEPLALLGAISQRTSNIKIGGSIIQPHFRNPIMLALSWATLDILSNGRTILTLGIGGGTPTGVKKEAELMGISPKKRGKALEETIQILRKLWEGDVLNFKGEIYEFEEVKIGYLPKQKYVPIWIAAGMFVPKNATVSATPGYTSKTGIYMGAFERVAKFGDGWFTIMAKPDEFKKAWSTISDIAKKEGRDPNNIVKSIEFWISLDSDRERAKGRLKQVIELYFGNPVDYETIERWSIYGTRSDCIEKIETYKKAGVDLIKLVIGSIDPIEMYHEIVNSILSSF